MRPAIPLAVYSVLTKKSAISAVAAASVGAPNAEITNRSDGDMFGINCSWFPITVGICTFITDLISEPFDEGAH